VVEFVVTQADPGKSGQVRHVSPRQGGFGHAEVL
jgi:hypothetical protein